MPSLLPFLPCRRGGSCCCARGVRMVGQPPSRSSETSLCGQHVRKSRRVCGRKERKSQLLASGILTFDQSIFPSLPLATLTVLPKSLSSAASFFGNFATWQVAQLAFGSLALYSFWMSMVARAALPRATAARVATTTVMDFFMVSSCPYSGPTVPRSIEVPWRGSADRVGLQPDGVMGRPGGLLARDHMG